MSRPAHVQGIFPCGVLDAGAVWLFKISLGAYLAEQNHAELSSSQCQGTWIEAHKAHTFGDYFWAAMIWDETSNDEPIHFVEIRQKSLGREMRLRIVWATVVQPRRRADP